MELPHKMNVPSMDSEKSTSPKFISRLSRDDEYEDDHLLSPSPPKDPDPLYRISPSMPELETASDYEIPRPPNPPKEPYADLVVPNPNPIPRPAIGKESLHIQTSSLPHNLNSAPGDHGIESRISPTPANSPNSSPINTIGSDLDYLLSKKSLDLKPLTVHKPEIPKSPKISPSSAINITVRRKNNRGSRHFRGRGVVTECCIRNLSLVDIPITDISEDRPLRAGKARSPSK